jgi:VanZ family protein
VVVAYDFSEQRVYINGEQRTRSEILKGDFSNWDPDCRLAIGNEVTGNRPWEGKIYYAAIFNKPLTDREIRQNYLSGMPSKINKEKMENDRFKARIPVARYLFNERKGDTIHDSGSDLNPVNLFMPNYIWRGKHTFLNFSRDYLNSRSWFSDVVINIMIFIPLGILMHGMLRARSVPTLKISLKALLAGALITFSVESIQFFSLTRNSSLIDVVMNMGGTALGIAIDRVYILFLNHRSQRLQQLLYEGAE